MNNNIVYHRIDEAADCLKHRTLAFIIIFIGSCILCISGYSALDAFLMIAGAMTLLSCVYLGARLEDLQKDELFRIQREVGD
jgi:hypothetical protein